MRLRCEALGPQSVDAFDCGSAALTEWLQQHAVTAHGQGMRTTVLLDDGDAVVGYYTIAPHLLHRTAAPRSIARGATENIPAILIAKFAVHQRIQGEGIGADLLVHALRSIREVGRIAGGRVVVVDAIDANAAAFWEHHNFQALPGQPLRLVIKLSTVAKALNEQWP